MEVEVSDTGELNIIQFCPQSGKLKITYNTDENEASDESGWCLSPFNWFIATSGSDLVKEFSLGASLLLSKELFCKKQIVIIQTADATQSLR